MHCVLDSSAALAWVMPGDATASTDTLLQAVAEQGAAAPGLWPLEIANILLLSERRGRITLSEREQALQLLHALPIDIDERTAAQARQTTLALAAATGLTVYDACYLELSVRLGLPLATLDRPLARAAAAAGVALALPT